LQIYLSSMKNNSEFIDFGSEGHLIHQASNLIYSGIFIFILFFSILFYYKTNS